MSFLFQTPWWLFCSRFTLHLRPFLSSSVAQAILSGDPARTYLNLAGGMAAWQSHGLPIVRHD